MMPPYGPRNRSESRLSPNAAAPAAALLAPFPLPGKLLPESRGVPVSRLRASLRRPPLAQPSLS